MSQENHQEPYQSTQLIHYFEQDNNIPGAQGHKHSTQDHLAKLYQEEADDKQEVHQRGNHHHGSKNCDHNQKAYCRYHQGKHHFKS